MFTGIIQATGEVRRLERRGGDVRLHVGTGKLDLGDVHAGDSIATSGVCLTVVEFDAQRTAVADGDRLTGTAADPGARVAQRLRLGIGIDQGADQAAGE